MRTGIRFSVLLTAAAALGTLYRFPPDRFPVYPPCLFHAATGLLCPGCGATRALAALVHGNLHEALHWNALFVVLLPPAIVYAAIALAWPRHPFATIRPGVVYTLLLVAVVFTVWRNVAGI